MSSELPAVSGTAANQVKFADSVYFDHPEYHRMMAVWRARDRAEAQADARHLSGDARVSFVEKEVTYFETTQDPTRAETIADSDAAALLKDVGIKFNVVDKFLREVDKFGTTHTPDHGWRSNITPARKFSRPHKTRGTRSMKWLGSYSRHISIGTRVCHSYRSPEFERHWSTSRSWMGTGKLKLPSKGFSTE